VADKIALIMGQTDYSADDAGAKLKSKNYDEIAVIREYLGSTIGQTHSTASAVSTATTTTATTSKNQLIYSEIRKFMDGCVRADPDKETNSADNTKDIK
jgi:hypothetical protein